MPPVMRHSITLSEKKALRDYYASSPVRPSQRELIQWFQDKYQVKLPQSTVSSILSPKYAHLDGLVARADGKKKQRPIKYPLLDAALFEWVQRKEQESLPITGDTLKRVAAQLWARIPEYTSSPQPEFSNGWLDGFKKRHSIKLSGSHNESGLLQNVAVIHEMTKNYARRDVFCLDEIALLWKLIPSKPPEIEEVRGIKRFKARVTATLCCNASGDEKLPLWVIGYSKFPTAFRNAGVAVKALDFEWKHNGIAWMTTSIMEEWLLWFDDIMEGRNVLLLLDRFNPHLTAVANIRATVGFKNTTIQWLPNVATGRYNPYEHGITPAVKALYRRSLLKFSIHYYELFQDPMRKMNVLRALRWLTTAWAHDLNPDIIKTGFEKAQLFKEDLEGQVPRRRGGRGSEDTAITSEPIAPQQRSLGARAPTSGNVALLQQRHPQHQLSGVSTTPVPSATQVETLGITLPSQHPFNLPHQFQGQHQAYHQNIQAARVGTEEPENERDSNNNNNATTTMTTTTNHPNGGESGAIVLSKKGDGRDGRVTSIGHDPRSDPDRYLTLAELIEDVQQLASRFASDQSMPFKLFLNPEEEEVVDCNDDILEQIASQFIGDRDAETDEENEPVRKVTWKEALDGLEALMQFEEQQPNGQIDVINVLHKHKRLIELRKT
ncbi:hypothetical protein DV113_004068 [Geotrichum candidum]|nr:hypothetical protein DV113_004068 [Geotrichum candidum]